MAVTNIARKVSQLYEEDLGALVGYRIGRKGCNNSKEYIQISGETRIEFVTEGKLLMMLTKMPSLDDYDCIIIDEAHERGKDTDLLLSRLRSLVHETRRKNNLKVVVMSASINAEKFSQYFGGCPIIKCKGRTFPVHVFYRPSPYGDKAIFTYLSDYEKMVDHAVDILFKDIITSEEGDVLIFLPGKADIFSCIEKIRKKLQIHNAQVLIEHAKK